MLIGFVGGDERMRACARFAAKDGIKPLFYEEGESLSDLAASVRLLVLPVPLTRDGTRVSGSSVTLEALERLSVPMLGGFVPKRLSERIYDIAQEEAFTLKNAALTAEGGIASALNATGRGFYHLSVGVVGFGRIAKILLRRLSSFGVPMTVYARRAEALAEAELLGARAVPLTAITVLGEDIVFNTVPAAVFAQNRVKEPLYLCDLGGGMPLSLPREDGSECAVTVCRGVPGVFAPTAAGEIVYESLRAYLSRNERGKENLL